MKLMKFFEPGENCIYIDAYGVRHDATYVKYDATCTMYPHFVELNNGSYLWLREDEIDGTLT